MAKADIPAATATGPAASTAVARTKSEVPEYIKKEMAEGPGPRGFEEMDNKDVTLPRLSLCQAMTPQRKESNPNYLPLLKEGEFFNSLTGDIYGRNVRIIPLFFYKSRIMFRDINEGGGIRCQAPDGRSCQMNAGGACLHSGWGPQGEPPECNEFYNYPSLLLPSMDLIVVSLKATGLKAGRAWNAMMRLRGADMFSGVYEMTSKAAQNAARQEYFTWIVKNVEENGQPVWATTEQYQFAGDQYSSVYEGIRTGRVKVDAEGLAGEQSMAGGASEM